MEKLENNQADSVLENSEEEQTDSKPMNTPSNPLKKAPKPATQSVSISKGKPLVTKKIENSTM